MEQKPNVAKQPYIIYTLPMSRTTQALTGGKIEKVWQNVQRFLINCTTAQIDRPLNLYLVGYTADEDHGEEPELAREILQKTIDVWGDGNTETAAYFNGVPIKQTKTKWDLQSSDLQLAIDFMINGQPYPKYNLGPLELIISYDFKLVDMTTKIELPNQQYPSRFLIWLTKNSCVSASLCFPFQEPDKNFFEYLNTIKEFIPFKFDDKYLRLGKANKKGTFNMFSKL